MSKPARQQPYTRPITEALGANAMLGQLLARLRESQERFAAVQPLLSPAMRRHVRPGSIDEEGWNLLVPNGAVGAKLRQSLPLIEQVLLDQGWPALPVRVKVQATQA